MLTTKSIVAFNIFSCPNGGANRKLFQVPRSKLSCSYPTSRVNKHRRQLLGREIFPIFTSTPELFYAAITKIETGVQSGMNPVPSPPPPDGAPGSWKLWIAGMLLSFVLPFWGNKLRSLAQLKNKVESIVETAEEVVEVIEKVADKVDKLAEDTAELSPEGSKLKEAALLIEHLAEEAENAAHRTGDLIDKVEEVEKEAEFFIGSAKNDQTTLINKEPTSSEPNGEAKESGPKVEATDEH